MDVYAGDAALTDAYEQVSAECGELRRQVGELRMKNAKLIDTVSYAAQDQMNHHREAAADDQRFD